MTPALRDYSRYRRLEIATIRAKLPGPVWRCLTRMEPRLWRHDGAPDTIGLVEIEEGNDRAYVLTAHRWHQLRRYVAQLEERLAELDPDPVPSAEEDRSA